MRLRKRGNLEIEKHNFLSPWCGYKTSQARWRAHFLHLSKLSFCINRFLQKPQACTIMQPCRSHPLCVAPANRSWCWSPLRLACDAGGAWASGDCWWFLPSCHSDVGNNEREKRRIELVRELGPVALQEEKWKVLVKWQSGEALYNERQMERWWDERCVLCKLISSP